MALIKLLSNMINSHPNYSQNVIMKLSDVVPREKGKFAPLAINPPCLES